MKFTPADQIKFYLYRSTNKIEMLYRQIERENNSNRIKRKVEWRGVPSREAEAKNLPVLIDEKLDAVVRRLNDEGQIGSLEQDLPYVRATRPIRWGLYNDSGIRDPGVGPMVYFGITDDQILFGMAGSSFNVEGMYGITSTSSRSVTPRVVEFLLAGMDAGERPSSYGDLSDGATQDVFDGVALANHYLRGPVQTVNFVAKVIARERYCKLRPCGDRRGLGILATPLYVAQTTPMTEDDDNDADKLGRHE